MMGNNHLSRWFYLVFCMNLIFMLSMIEGKGFSGGRGGGSFKGGSKPSGTFGGSSSYNRVNSHGNNMGKPRTGSSFKKNAGSFAAGAVGGIAAYSIMRSMSGSHHSRPSGYYGPGYGTGETCVNNEDLNGTVFGQFRCPLYGFPQDAKQCCGDYGEQYCCVREPSSRFSRGSAHFGWIVLVIVVLFIGILFWARRNRQRQKEILMVPGEPLMNEQNRPPPFYQPPPPPAGYPPPPQGPNPYEVPPGNYNPYAQQSHMAYPPQQQQFKSY